MHQLFRNFTPERLVLVCIIGKTFITKFALVSKLWMAWSVVKILHKAAGGDWCKNLKNAMKIRFLRNIKTWNFISIYLKFKNNIFFEMKPWNWSSRIRWRRNLKLETCKRDYQLKTEFCCTLVKNDFLLVCTKNVAKKMVTLWLMLPRVTDVA